MYSVTTEFLESERCYKYALFDGVAPVNYATVLELWRGSYKFRDWFSRQLADCPLAVYRWETPPVTAANVHDPFEFVLIDAPEIGLPADPQPFADCFASTSETVLYLENLGGDALMVVPAPRGDESVYPHLAAFLRNGPPEQIDRLWQSVGGAVTRRLGDAPLWLNTAGGGVAWLHVRLDSQPKYYVYQPYTSLPAVI